MQAHRQLILINAKLHYAYAQVCGVEAIPGQHMKKSRKMKTLLDNKENNKLANEPGYDTLKDQITMDIFG